jgi:hypothetical protein
MSANRLEKAVAHLVDTWSNNRLWHDSPGCVPEKVRSAYLDVERTYYALEKLRHARDLMGDVMKMVEESGWLMGDVRQAYESLNELVKQESERK